MARFVYRLENILQIKSKLEEQAKMEFAEKQEKLRMEQDKMRILQERKRGCLQESANMANAIVSPLDLRNNREELIAVDGLILQQLKQIERAGKEMDVARRKLEELRQERKAQERLKEKDFEQFLADEKAREAKETDELISFTYGERRKEESDG